MKKILYVFDYVYWRILEFTRAHRGFEPAAVSSLYEMILLLPPILFTVVPICKSFGLSVHRYTPTWCMFMVATFIISIPIGKRCKKIEEDKNIADRWKDETPEQHKKRGWLIWALIINNLIIVPILVIVLSGHGIL